ncbi:unnamed protein product [Amoebophrya sp. A25]|nr:unnamed protein product [Amoebophrya sp. A25]|eukprot:GSA25T00003171001.1
MNPDHVQGSIFETAKERELASVWPVELFEKHRPRIFEDAVDFIDELLTGDFVHGVYILRDGCRKLGLELESCFDKELAECLRNSKNVYDFLQEIRRRGLESLYKARVQYLVEKDLVKTREAAEDTSSTASSMQLDDDALIAHMLKRVADESKNAKKKDVEQKTKEASSSAGTTNHGAVIGEVSTTSGLTTTATTSEDETSTRKQEDKHMHSSSSKATTASSTTKKTYRVKFQKDVCKDKDLTKQIDKLNELLEEEKKSVLADAEVVSTEVSTYYTRTSSTLKQSLYMTELRHNAERPHPLQEKEKVKTVLRRDMRDVCAEYGEYALYWDRYDEGVFLGAHRSGKALHIDQILWQNIGKNWTGYKLLAAWPVQETSKLLHLVGDCLFLPREEEEEEWGVQQERESHQDGASTPSTKSGNSVSSPSAGCTSSTKNGSCTTDPDHVVQELLEKKSRAQQEKKLRLPALELALLKKAAAVCLIRPGDVFYFTGGIPHVTLSVGTEEMNVCAYESIVTLNRTHVLHFLSQSDFWQGFRVKGLELYADMAMPESELKDVKADMVDRLAAIGDRWIDTMDFLEEFETLAPPNKRRGINGSARDLFRVGKRAWGERYPELLNVIAAGLQEGGGGGGSTSNRSSTQTASTDNHDSFTISTAKTIPPKLEKYIEDLIRYPDLSTSVTELWRRLRSSDLMRRLQRQFIDSVNLCVRDDYFRKELPRRIFEVVAKMETLLDLWEAQQHGHGLEVVSSGSHTQEQEGEVKVVHEDSLCIKGTKRRKIAKEVVNLCPTRSSTKSYVNTIPYEIGPLDPERIED